MSNKDIAKAEAKFTEKIVKAFVKEDYKKVHSLSLEFFDTFGPIAGDVQFCYIVSLVELEDFNTALNEIGGLLTYETPYALGASYGAFLNLEAVLRDRIGGNEALIKACQQLCESVYKDGVYEGRGWAFVLMAFAKVIAHGEKAAQEVLTLLHEAVAAEPRLAEGYLLHLTEGLALAHLGQTDEGTRAFERIYQEEDRGVALPHLDMATICATGGSIFLAQQYYKKAEQCVDFDDDTAASIGDFFFDFGLHQYTAYWYGQITDPEIRPDILPTLAYAYYKLNDERMLDILREAIAIDPLATQEVFKPEFQVNDATELFDMVQR